MTCLIFFECAAGLCYSLHLVSFESVQVWLDFVASLYIGPEMWKIGHLFVKLNPSIAEGRNLTGFFFLLAFSAFNI